MWSIATNLSSAVLADMLEAERSAAVGRITREHGGLVGQRAAVPGVGRDGAVQRLERGAEFTAPLVWTLCKEFVDQADFVERGCR